MACSSGGHRRWHAVWAGSLAAADPASDAQKHPARSTAACHAGTHRAPSQPPFPCPYLGTEANHVLQWQAALLVPPPAQVGALMCAFSSAGEVRQGLPGSWGAGWRRPAAHEHPTEPACMHACMHTEATRSVALPRCTAQHSAAARPHSRDIVISRSTEGLPVRGGTRES